MHCAYSEFVSNATRGWFIRMRRFNLRARSNEKTPRIQAGRSFVCRANDALINYNKLRVARADHTLRVCKPVHVNRDPAAV